MEQEIWSFKYEPTKLEDMILNETVRKKLEKAVTEKPNIILYGKPGTGKGTFTNIFFNITGCDKLWINASDETSIETIRSKVNPYSHAPSPGIKYVVFNESEALSSGKSGAQKMLKEVIEQVHTKTRFLFMTNEIHNMNSAILSRCMEINLDSPPIGDIGRFMSKILKSENVAFDKKVFIDIIKTCYPDIRKTIWTMQENTYDGKLNSSEVYSAEALFAEILKYMLDKDVENLRSAVKNNYINYKQLYEFLFEKAGEFKSPGGAILQIGDHLRWHPAGNPEINFIHMVFDMMWKKII
jgi:DNA polymerase III delta prime subunit